MNLKHLSLLVPIAGAVLLMLGWVHGYVYHVSTTISCIVIVLLLSAKQLRTSSWLIVLVFLFSIWGDWMLRHRNGINIRFVYGIALYFAAHVGYLLFSLKNGKVRWWFLVVLLAAYLPFFFLKLMPAISNNILLMAVLLYLLISCISLAAAMGLRLSSLSRWLFFTGIACMVFSDTLISFREFLGDNDLTRTLYSYLMYPTYYASQICATAAVISKQ